VPAYVADFLPVQAKLATNNLGNGGFDAPVFSMISHQNPKSNFSITEIGIDLSG
jgi:hypothetical protein